MDLVKCCGVILISSGIRFTLEIQRDPLNIAIMEINTILTLGTNNIFINDVMYVIPAHFHQLSRGFLVEFHTVSVNFT